MARDDEDRSTLRKVGRGALVVLGGSVLLVVGLLAALQTGPVSHWAFHTAVELAAPEGVSVSAGEVDGNWLTGLNLARLRVEGPPGVETLGADTVRLRYPFLAWRPGGHIRVDSLRVRGAAFSLVDSAGDRYRVDSLTLDAAGTDLRTGAPGIPSVHVEGWTLAGRFTPPGTAAPWGRVRAGGFLTPQGVVLDTLRVRSPRSTVTGWGRVALDGHPAPTALAWVLEADPLALADLDGLAPVPETLLDDSLFLVTEAAPFGDSARVRLLARSTTGGEAEVDGSWGGDDTGRGAGFRARLEGVDLRRWVGEALPEAAAGLLTAELDGRVSLGAEGGGLDLRTELHASLGPHALAGDLTWLRRPGSVGPVDSLAVRLDTLALEEVTVSGGALRVRKAAGPLASAPVRGEVRLAHSSMGSLVLDTARVALRWEGDSGAVDARIAAPRGTGVLAAGVTVGSGSGSIRLDSLAVDSLLPLPQETEAPHPLRITGTLAGEVRWDGPPGAAADPGALEAELTLRTAGSRLGPVSPDSTRTELVWRGGTGEAELRAALPDEGSVLLRANGQLLDSLVVVVEEGRFQGIRARSWLDAAPEGVFSGEVDGRWSGAAGTGEVRLALDPSPLGNDTLRGVEARARLTPDTLHGTLQGRLGGGEVRARVAATPVDSAFTWDASAEADLPALGPIFGRPDSAVALVARARAGSVGPGEGAWAEVSIPGARGWGARVDTARVSARLEGERVVVDTLLIRSNLATIHGGGELPTTLLQAPDSLAAVPVTDSTPRRFALLARLPDSVQTLEAGPVTSLMARSGSLHVATACDPRGCSLESGVSLGSVLVGSTSVAMVQGEMEGTLEPGPTLTGLELDARVQGIRTSTAGIREARVEALLEEGDLTVDGSTVIDDRRNAELGVDAELGSESRSATVRSVRFQMDEDQWRLASPATLTWGGEGIRLDTLAVTAGAQRILAEGVWAGPEGHDFTLQLDSFRVGTLSDLAGAPGLDGFLDATVYGYGDASLPFLQAHAAGHLTHDDRPLHRLRAEADRGAGFVALDARLTDSLDHRRLRLSGEVPLADSDDGEWQLVLDADSLPLAWMEPWLPDEAARGLSGTARGEIRLQGPRTAPTASGPLAVDRGRLTLPAAGITLRDLRLRSTLADHTLTVDTLRARSEGSVRVAGSVTLPELGSPTELSLEVRADDFLAVNTRALRTLVAGTARISGTGEAPRVEGEVEVVEADLRLDEGLGGGSVEDVTLSDEDWATLQTRFGIPRPEEVERASPLLTQSALDLSVALGRDIWLRQEVNPEMAVQFTGDVSVSKESGEETPRLRGEVEAIPQRSYLEQFGRRFQLEDGTVFLRGAPEETEVQLTSVYQVPPRDGDASQVSIRLALTGEVGRLSLALSSTPSMENSDIVSYLATGRPASSAFSGDGGGGSVTDIGRDVVASQLTGLVEQFAMEDVGLDVVEIQRDGLEGATLVAGQYVTPELFLGFRQPMTFGQADGSGARPGQTEAEVEWRALRWLLLNLETGGDAFRFFLEGSIGY